MEGGPRASETKTPLPPFLSAAKPTDQGEESVVLLVVVVVVVVGGGTIFKCPMYSFLRCEKQKLFPCSSKSLSLFTPLLKRFPINSYLRCEK